VPTFPSYDLAPISYRREGEGPPLVVVPGGPGRDADYLGDLGGLARTAGRTLVVLEPRGTGASPAPHDHSAYAVPRLAEDLLALVDHLGVGAVDVLAHSAGCAVAVVFAARHPTHLRRLVLVTPGGRVVSIEVGDEEWEAQIARRRDEPWFAAAREALESDDATPETRLALSPFLYGSWTPAAQQHAASDPGQRNRAAGEAFWADPADSTQLRATLASLAAPVRILVGELDLVPGPRLAAELARVFPDARVQSQSGAGHFPWVDDPARFAALVTDALTGDGDEAVRVRA
jgi:proline iminopeptidase